ncbi:hypothetical protein E4T49_04960 [Aureobasidium sp. EXF-10728]|nr:hypothetical protein E4T49_04960 [Aureobasidium sp. EXF-10728]
MARDDGRQLPAAQRDTLDDDNEVDIAQPPTPHLRPRREHQSPIRRIARSPSPLFLSLSEQQFNKTLAEYKAKPAAFWQAKTAQFDQRTRAAQQETAALWAAIELQNTQLDQLAQHTPNTRPHQPPYSFPHASLAGPTYLPSYIPLAMDPFEVRMRFNSQLQHLNASVTSAQKAAVWAIKYREWDEDLHSCILENLERNSLNNRANIFYFFETLCDVASAANHIEFVRMMERDILRIVDLVAPEDGSGAANVKVVRKVLRNLAGKKYLQQQTVDELEDCIKDRDNIGGLAGTASPEEAVRNSNGNVRVEKRQVEQRIEEDRERHKRLREGIWAVNEDEFEKIWVETADLNQDDYRTAIEEEAERKQYAGLHRTALLGA